MTYYENFYATTFEDAAATTADWNTALGHVALHDLQLVLDTPYDTPGAATAVVTDGSLVYVADWTSGIAIFEAGTAPPTLVGSLDTPGEALGVAVAGDDLFVADGTAGLQVIDLTLPSVPVTAGSLSLAGITYDVAVCGDYVVAAHRRTQFPALNRITVIDVSDPSVPVAVGLLNLPGQAWRLQVVGDRVHVAGGTAGLQIVSIASPASPALVGTYDTAGEARDVHVDGDTAYVADMAGMVVLNVANPAAPTLLASEATTGSALGIAVDGNYAYVADSADGVVEFSVRVPSAPILLETRDTPGSAVDVAVGLPTIYVADQTSGLALINAGYGPTILQDMTVGTGSVAFSGSANDIVIAGDVAYVADGAAGVVAVDVSQPEAPWVLGSHDTAGDARALDLQGDRLYVADGSAGLVILDVTNPASPSLVGGYDTSGDASAVSVSGTHAYVADGTSLQVIDVSSPATPVFTASVAVAAWGVDVEGDHAYVAGGAAGVRVIDVSDPTTPSLLATESAYFAVDIDVVGDDAFVATGSLLWLDVSDPSDPRVVDSDFSSEDLARVTVAGEFVFAANRYASSVLDTGVIVYRRTGSSLLRVDFLRTSADPAAIAVAGDDLFAAVRPNAFSPDDGIEVARFFKRYLDVAGDTGQSGHVAYYCGSHNVVAARITPTQVGSIDWSLSNGGDFWHDVAPGAWTALWPPGCSLKWRSRHDYQHDGVNPACSNLVIDMLLEIPTIDSVTDVPDDQGGQLEITWTRSGYDVAGSGLPVTEYVVYRRSAVAPATWDSVAVASATQADQYALTVPTEIDHSNFTGPAFTAFFVRARTASPGAWFDAPVDSASSVDDIAPGAAEGFTVEYFGGGGSANLLSWSPPTDPDLLRFYVYRSTDPEFEPTRADIVDSTGVAALVEWKDPDHATPVVHYMVAAVDSAGNVGPAVDPESVSGAGETPPPVRFTLGQNSPNPFNPSTTIAFSLARPGPVRLDVYDAAGRAVRTLVQGDLGRGPHVVEWDGNSRTGGPAVSGVYFYRLVAGDRVLTRKMLLLK